MTQDQNELDRFLPPGTSEEILAFLKDHRVRLTIKKHRKSKFGDYRPPSGRIKLHQISVNGTLNPYAFLLTLLHEMAHLLVFEKHQGKVSPHGKAWKYTFGQVLEKWMEKDIFPEPILTPLRHYAHNPKASTFSDPVLFAALSTFDSAENPKIYLRDLQDQQRFGIGKKIFAKGPLQRTRHLCTEEKTGRRYLIHFMAEVQPLP